MNYKITWVENKSNDWKVASLECGGVKTEGVSINRVNKKGEVFPNFDSITLEGTVDGELWNSPSGKHYLFAPKVASTGTTGAYKGQQIAKAQETKREDIKEAQGRKEESIALAGAQRDAVLIVTKFNITDWTEDHIQEEIIKWRNWFLSSKFTDSTIPF